MRRLPEVAGCTAILIGCVVMLCSGASTTVVGPVGLIGLIGVWAAAAWGRK